jgi:hypothetical protein
MRKIEVREIAGEIGNNIGIDFGGVTFMSSPLGVYVVINIDEADKIAFQIQSLLQDIERRKTK